jgi:predicted RNase H-like nuclease (RuvC/YqgF family)
MDKKHHKASETESTTEAKEKGGGLTPEAIKALQEQAKEAGRAAMREVLAKATAPYEKKIKAATERKEALEAEAAELSETIEQLSKELRRINGEDEPLKQRKAAKASGGTRVRRDPEQLKADALKMVAVLKANGKSGASAKELTDVAAPKLGMKLADFISQYAEVKVEKVGDRGNNVVYKLA